MEQPRASISFVVRACPGKRGHLTGIVELVKTGAKHPFDGAEAIGPLIAEMVRHETRGMKPARRAAGPAGGVGARGTRESPIFTRMARARSRANRGGQQ
jgi:hypothetical protein